MKNQKQMKTWFYRVTCINRANKEVKYLAEVKADLDESARRLIISKILHDGGRALTIYPSSDSGHYPGEAGKRTYNS